MAKTGIVKMVLEPRKNYPPKIMVEYFKNQAGDFLPIPPLIAIVLIKGGLRDFQHFNDVGL
jgi:hypothetical protein